MDNQIYSLINESIFVSLLNEAKSPEEVLGILSNKYIEYFSEKEISSIMEIDPTKKYSYTQWALKAISNENEYDYDTINNNTLSILESIFETAKSNNDFQLQSFQTVTEAEENMTYFLGRSAYSIVYEDEGWIIYVPETYEAERYIVWHLYDGASWCTAANSDSGRRYFAKYNEDGQKLYINANKNTEEIYQYSPKSGEFNDSNNYQVEDFENIGITEGAISFYKDKLGFDIEYELYSERFNNEAEEIGDTGVYLWNDGLYTDFDNKISPDDCNYTSNIRNFWSNEHVILAPYYGYGERYDIYLNHDAFDGMGRGWHLGLEGVCVDAWSYYSDGFYSLYKDYFIYFELDEGWDNGVDNVADAECMDDERPDGFWVITKKDGSKALFSRHLYDYDNEYTSEDLLRDGLNGFGSMIDDIYSTVLEDYGSIGDETRYIRVNEEHLDFIKELLDVLNYTDYNIIEAEDCNTDFIIYSGKPPYDSTSDNVNAESESEYSMAEGVRKKFNIILENISKNYNPDKLKE